MAVNVKALYRRARALAHKGEALQGNINAKAVGQGKATLLHIAAAECDAETVGALLDAGVDKDALDEWGASPLVVALAAAGMGKTSADAARLLLDADADIHPAKEASGYAVDALILGCIGGFEDVITTLIDRGASAENLKAYVEGEGENLQVPLMLEVLALVESRDTLARLDDAIPQAKLPGRGTI